MATLFNTKISATYPGLIKTIDNTALNATLKELTDGSGNQSGLYANTSGDFKVTAILEFGSLKDTGENIIITKFVDAADGIPNNNNDTSIPTSKAVKDYVEAHVTAQDLDFGGDGGTTGAIDLDSQVFQINGTSNEIETSASNQVLTIGLPNSVTISGTFTGATFAGQLSGTISSATTATTQSAGDNSTKVATTAYVDVLDAASDLDFSGDSGTGDVTLNSQVFAVTGTANQIESTASGQGLSLKFPTAGVVLPNNSTTTTQSAGNNSTKIATTAYVDTLDAASDLDIAGDSGTGDVNLNTQTFTLSGTTNQVVTAVSGQTATFSLPATVHRNLQGNVTGNADTATKWATARDLSLTGQATATLSSVDGTSAVSGAITLDNNSVTSKVLTGLPTPSASSVLATDSIVAGIGKLQSQINGLAGGLRFMGTWNVSTNSPALASGGGETASGTTTSTTANKLVDSNASFSGAVSVGNKVVNQVDGQTALVSNVDSDTTLSLDADIMLSGEAYTVDASPFLTQGHYYVVSVGGARTLNGVTNWSVGDWAIVGANNEWTILDHTDVEGTGTAGNISKWSGPGTIADSIIAESGTAINITGSLATTLGASFTGNLAVNTNKFTANATSGNVAFPGDLAINTNKFTVAATSGNTVIGGTGSFGGSVSIGVSSPISGFNLDVQGGDFRVGDDANQGFEAGYSSGSGKVFVQGYNRGTSAFVDMLINNSLTVLAGGNSTFAGDVGIGATPNSYTNQTVLTINGSSIGRLDLESGGTLRSYLFAQAANTTLSVDSGFFTIDVGGSERMRIADTLITVPTVTEIRADIGSNKFAIGNMGDASSQMMISSRGFITLNTSNTGSALDATERMRIDSSGNVTVGDSTYGSSLGQVRIVNNASSTPATLALFGYGNVDNDSGFANIDFAMQSSGTGGNITASIRGIANGTGENASDLAFYTKSSSGSLSERMRIDSSGNVAIGSQTANKLFNLADPAQGGEALKLHFEASSANDKWAIYAYDRTNGHYANMSFGENVINIDASTKNSTFAGNVGIGVTPEAWTVFKPLQIGQASAFVGRISSNQTDITTNFYYDGAEKRITTGYAQRYTQTSDGNHQFWTAGTDSADSAITFSKKFEILNNGNATFAGDVDATGNITTDGIFKVDSAPDNDILEVTQSGRKMALKTSFAGDTVGSFWAFKVSTGSVNGTMTDALIVKPQQATFAGNVSIGDVSGAKLSISGSVGTTNGTEALPTHTFYSDLNTGMFRVAADTLAFSTAGTEKMRITSGGNIQSNANSGATIGYGFQLSPQSGYSQIYLETNATQALFIQRFYNPNGNVGNIMVSGSATIFSTSSDYRLKEDLQDFAGLDMVSKIPVYDFKWKTDESRSYGVMAHELQEVLPQAVVGEKDAEEMQSVDYSKIVPLLVKSIQELKAEVDKLKQECNCK